MAPEDQTDDALSEVRSDGHLRDLNLELGEARRIAVRPAAHKAYNRALQARLATTSWAAGCGSWYKTDDGVMPNNWAGNTAEFARMMKRFDAEAYEIA